MSLVRLLRLRLALLWSLGSFATHIAMAMAASQRVLVTIALLATAIGLSATISHALIVAAQQDQALVTPPAELVTRTIRPTDNIVATQLQLPEAKTLWDAYKKELSAHSHNRDLLKNLILLASALDLQKDVMVYQRQLHLADPLLACEFSTDENGLLDINCPPTKL